MILGLSHVALTVSDLNRSIQFYQRTFGFTVLSDAERKGEWIEKITGIPGFHSRTVYLASTLYRHLEMFGFYHPSIVAPERDVHLRVRISHCVMRGEGGKKRNPAGVVTRQDPDGMVYRILNAKGRDQRNPKEPIREFLYPVFIVEDLEKSLGFYRDTLGLETVNRTEEAVLSREGAFTEDPKNGTRVLLKARTGICLELVQPTDYKVIPASPWQMQRIGLTHVAFGVKGMDGFYAKLTQEKVNFKSPPTSIITGPHQGGKAVYLTSSEGITLEFIDSPLILEEVRRAPGPELQRS